MPATKKDYLLVLIIGIAVGFFVQPILSNTILSENYICFGAENGVVAPTCHQLTRSFTLGIRAVIFIFFSLLAPFALGVASFIGKRIPVLFQFAKFAAVGSLNSFMDLGIFNLLSYIFVDEIRNISRVLFITFKSTSFFIATLNSYLWNKNWTFGDREKTHAETLIKFYIITGINYFLNTGVAFAVKEIGPSSNLWVSFVAPVCGILAAMFSNFLSYKYIVFKERS